ncbi:MAG: universal stress protein [Dehalococcoidales bacterium]|jgi:nucleotide-binding universal stress UspA family protein|nr:universal stress protein [Dehalococcoidales bacterium]MDD4322655.1 universal stress protein [Dehalococcoidales bacterium]MDD4794211.1 universal stress protein [Dehalococcoidales bacterium]MDD5122300.1 universal stress protein [Dehalococcoidales bacterium]MDD5498474.1 universal stress protein [Dehalococcoidales bacterium]
MEFNRILVPVAGTKADEAAMELACCLSRGKKQAEIFAVHVIPVDRSLPIDAEIGNAIDKAEDLLEQVTSEAEHQGYDVDSDILQAREVGPAVIEEAVSKKADLILIGVFYKKQYGQFCLGDVVPYVLKNAPCPVLVYHHPQEDQPKA